MANVRKLFKTPIITKQNKMALAVPTAVHIELTSSCCFNCRHCYNFWRKEKSAPVFMTESRLDTILDELISNAVMHVIFTGGEPLLNSRILLHGIRRMKDAGASVTCNSTLAVKNSRTDMKQLKEAGLEHVLTSLNSHRPETNDHLVSIRGAHDKIIAGIKNAVDAGIRISVNMIISESNIGDIYETARLAHSLGAKKFFGTRVTPHVSKNINEQKEFLIYKEDARRIIRELMRIEGDFDMQVGTLVPFPLCFLAEGDDLDRFARFYTHGCPAGNKMISLNANGDAHACVHESKSYGNILDIGLKAVWKNMRPWRSGEYFPDLCKSCPVFDECNGGCRLCALAYGGAISAPDHLRVGWEGRPLPKRFSAAQRAERPPVAVRCSVPKTLRFRKENGFYSVDRFGSEIVCVPDDIAEILKERQKNGGAFIPEDAGLNDADLLDELMAEKLILVEEKGRSRHG